MKTNTVWKTFMSEEQTLALSHRYNNGAYYHLMLTIDNTIVSEHIKDICIQEISPLLESIADKYITTSIIESRIGDSLQQVNHAFSLFVEETNTHEPVNIDGALVISYQGNIFVSLIGRSSLLICRGEKTIYNMTNTHTAWDGSISQFTDYISGSIHSGDSILIFWFDYSLILHHNELNKIAKLINDNNPDMLNELEELINSRTEEANVWFMSLVKNISQTIDFSWVGRQSQRVFKYLPQWAIKKTQEKAKTIRMQYSYWITLWILGVIVLWSIYSVINGALNRSTDNPTITTDNRVEVVTIDDIKKEISNFEKLDMADSDKKGEIYKEINDKLEFLKSKGKRIDDVLTLQKILQNKYYEWFNIISITTLNDIDGEFKNTYSFSDLETKTIGEPLDFAYNQWFYVGGSKWAIIKWINKDVKWTSVSYALASTMQGCTLDLTQSWLYCFDTNNKLYRVTTNAVTPLGFAWDISLPTDIRDIGTFWRNNIYLLINPKTNGGENLIERFTIQPWNYWALWTVLAYKYKGSGSGDSTAFSHMTIDGNFLARNSNTKTLHQMQRDPNTNNLIDRIIKLEWGDTSFVTYSEDVQAITSANSRYVYLLDKKNNTFTVYLSTPLKTTQWNETKYTLRYIMRYTFDQSIKIIDAVVPDNNTSQPILYILTSQWIYETNLNQAIKLYENK